MNELTGVQLSEWEAYDRLDPVGEWRDDFRMAFLASLITNLGIQIHGKQGTKLTEFTDFMPEWDIDARNEPKRQSVEDMKQMLLSFAQSHNKRLEQKKARIKKR